MTEYEKLVLRALAQMLRVLGNIENGREKHNCDRTSDELDRKAW
ncbi:hypothetical protein [Bacillus sp. S3]|nr:hypothetical protein [Bacillus sp. S3]